jgi:hypothetical protein
MQENLLFIFLFPFVQKCLVMKWFKPCCRETCLAPNESLEQKVNYGGLLLQALLEFWPKPYNTEDESDPEQVQYSIYRYQWE